MGTAPIVAVAFYAMLRGFRLTVRTGWSGGWFVLGNALCALTDAIWHDWGWAAFSTAAAALCAWDWWNRRGKRAAKLAGAKSRALRDALTARMPKPAPALRGTP